MARRPRIDVEDDTNSLKENSVLPNGLNEAQKKVTQEKVKLENGKGKATRVEPEATDEEPDNRHTVDIANADDDADADALGELENEEGSPRSRKRARANTNGDLVPSSPKREQVMTLPRDDDG
jgi:hypothetical protein